jgi:hypothetical protein
VVTVKNAMFWDVVPCDSCKNRRFGPNCYLLLSLITANVVPRSPIRVTLMIEVIRSSETSALTKATRRKIPEDGSSS